MLKVKQSEI